MIELLRNEGLLLVTGEKKKKCFLRKLENEKKKKNQIYNAEKSGFGFYKAENSGL